MRPKLLWVGVALTGVAVIPDCSDAPICNPLVIQSDTTCSVSADCSEGGAPGLSCINGVCRLPCTADVDCQLQAPPSGSIEESMERSDWPAECLNGPKAVCEDQLCVPACLTDAECSNGERCLRLPGAKTSEPGRCAVYLESFEIPAGGSGVDFATLGWVTAAEGRIDNPKLRIGWLGRVGCNDADPTICGGPAASGIRYGLLGTSAAPAKGTPVSGPTCGACACCLDCLLDPPTKADAALPDCSRRCEDFHAEEPTKFCSITPPAAFDECPATTPGCDRQPVCPATPPARCAAICNECSQCPATTNTVGAGLAMCESMAAAKGCTACPQCDVLLADCKAAQCSICARIQGPADRAACDECVRTNCAAQFEQPACQACYDCSELSRSCVGSEDTEVCINLKARCEAQGNDGCYQTPIDYPRAQLTDEEQSITSPPLPVVAGLTGNVTLEFSYVAFNVGRSFAQSTQGVAPPLWPRIDEALLVQFCAANCEQEGSFVGAKYADGREVVLPPLNLRSNGLILGLQSSLDWRAGKIKLPIPENFRTPTFRVRFVPRLADDHLIGLDDFMIRRRG